VPLADWFRGPLRDRMMSYCDGSELEDLGINPQPVRKLWGDFQRGQNHRTDLLWQMFMLVAWARRFKTADAPVTM
jgi:asparagine synthase (glutamine-hydrolysing)